MENKEHLLATRFIAARIRLIMELLDLEVAGFAAFLGRSESNVYALIAGRKRVTWQTAWNLGLKLGFNGNIIFDPDSDIPEAIRDSAAVKQFREEYKTNPEFFLTTKVERNIRYFLECEILPSPLLNEPRYVWEVSQACKDRKRDIDSDTLSKKLKQLVSQRKLQSKKMKIKRRNGSYGNRVVDVFFKQA